MIASALSNNWFKKFIRNTGWMGLAQGARILDVLVRSIIIARVLTLDGFAAYAVALAFVGLVTELANLNLGAVLLTFGARYQEDKDENRLKALLKLGYVATFCVAILATIIISGLLFVSYDVFLQQSGLYLPIVILGIASAINLMDSVNKSILRLLDRFQASCMVDFFVMIFNIGFLIFFLNVFDKTPVNAIYATAICLVVLGIVSTIVAWVILGKVVPNWWSGRFCSLKQDIKPMFKTAIGNSLAASLQRMMRKGDVLLLAALIPGGIVGLYDIGKKLSALVLLARDAVVLAAFPQISKALAAGRKNKLRQLIGKLFIIGVPISIVIVAAMWFLSPFLVTIMYGEKYVLAAPILAILTITSILYLLFFWASAVMLNLDKVKVMVFANLAGLIAMVASGLVLVPLWQGIGMAWAVVIGTSVQFAGIGLITRIALSAPHIKDNTAS